jgi:hypothetical protein
MTFEVEDPSVSGNLSVPENLKSRFTEEGFWQPVLQQLPSRFSLY